MDKLVLNIKRQQRALRAMRQAESSDWKQFWFNIFSKVWSNSITHNEDGVPYDSKTRN